MKIEKVVVLAGSLRPGDVWYYQGTITLRNVDLVTRRRLVD